MALSSSAMSATMKAATPFKRDNKHYQGDVMLDAIANGVYSVFTTSAIIIVNAGGGGSYPIAGVTADALEAAINSSLTIAIKGEHAKGGILSGAAAKGVAVAISAAKVYVPAMTAGIFPVVGFSASTIKTTILGALAGGGINVKAEHAKIMVMVDAIASAISDIVMANAQYMANGVSGGVFVMK